MDFLAENYRPYKRKRIVIEADFFRSSAFDWLVRTRGGPLAMCIYRLLQFNNNGLSQGAFVYGGGTDPTNWVPETAESIQKYFPAYTVAEVEMALDMLLTCGLLIRYPGTKEIQPYFYSDRKDSYFVEECVFADDEEPGGTSAMSDVESDIDCALHGTRMQRIEAYYYGKEKEESKEKKGSKERAGEAE